MSTSRSDSCPETAIDANSKSEDVAARFRGKLIWRDQEEYDEARVGRVFNARRPQRFPSAVLFAECTDDVINAVQLAQEQNLKISIRSGGHSWAAWSVRENSLLIDFDRMREMSLDQSTGIVTVSPAITSGELNPYLERFGLFFPGGHCPEVGLGGFLLQGGMGWNTRGWGWACLRIAAIDVVTADGRLVHASESENPDLFWAARGAGPGYFAVVVRFYLRPRPLPKALTSSTHIYPIDAFNVVMRWLHDTHATVHEKVELVAISLHVPLPGREETDSQCSLLVHAVYMGDTQEEAREALSFMETCPVLEEALLKSTCIPTSMQKEIEVQRLQNPKEHRYAADNLWLSGPADEVVPALKECFSTLPSKRTFALWYSMAPLPEKLPDMALSLHAEVYIAVYTVWSDPADDDRCRQWLYDQMKRLESISDGTYLGDSDFLTRSSKFMASENFRRLEELRAKYDPEGRIESYLAHPDHTLNTNPWET